MKRDWGDCCCRCCSLTYTAVLFVTCNLVKVNYDSFGRLPGSELPSSRKDAEFAPSPSSKALSGLHPRHHTSLLIVHLCMSQSRLVVIRSPCIHRYVLQRSSSRRVHRTYLKFAKPGLQRPSVSAQCFAKGPAGYDTLCHLPRIGISGLTRLNRLGCQRWRRFHGAC